MSENINIANAKIMEYAKRNGRFPKKEDVLDLVTIYQNISESQLEEFLSTFDTPEMKVQLRREMSATHRRGRRKKGEAAPEPKETLSQEKVLEKIKYLQSELKAIPTIQDLADHEIPVDSLINHYGSWKNVKEVLKNTTNYENALIELTTELGKIPTLAEVREHNIDVNFLLNKYKSWNNVKETLNLYSIYDNKIKEEIVSIQKKTIRRPSMKECRKAGIDVNYLLRRYGGWKQVMHELHIEKYDSEALKEKLISSSAALSQLGESDEKELDKIFKIIQH